MIVPMKKIHLLVQKKDTDQALDDLRELGTVHVQPQQEYRESALVDVKAEVDLYEHAVTVLKGVKADLKKSMASEPCGDCEAVAEEIREMVTEMNRLKEETDKRAIRIKKWEPWGDFDPEDIRALVDRKIFIQLFEIPEKDKIEVPEGVIMETLDVSGGIRRCAAIMTENLSLPYEPQRVYLPRSTLKEKYEMQEQELEVIASHKEKLKEYVKYLDGLQNVLMQKKDKFKFSEVRMGLDAQEELIILKGFCPTDAVSSLESYAEKQNWALLVEDPSEEDPVPTLLKNPEWVNLSKPVLNIIEILPGYKEVDVSTVFLVFFTFFFAILIGDAAYGLIFMGLVAFAHFKFRGKVDPTAFHLGYLLTGATCLWGVLTGTYFGQEWLPSSVKALVPWLTDNTNVQWLCFTVALLHLSIARVWTFFVKLPSITAVAEVGWLLIVWGMYYLANMFVLNKPFPVFAGWFFMAGIPIALLFMVPFKDFVKKVPQELIPFMLSVIGAGTDIISYIRLFAVGLATVAVADAANFMPEALPGVGYVVMVFLHVLNMILAALAILVHAVRLNVLEFSGHLGLEWSGTRYEPFRKLKVA